MTSFDLKKAATRKTRKLLNLEMKRGHPSGKLLLTLGILSILFQTPLHSQIQVEQPLDHAAFFLKQTMEENSDKGSDHLFDAGDFEEPNLEKVKAGLETKKILRSLGKPMYSKILGVAHLDNQTDMVYAYVIFDREIMFFRITFYKAGEKWLFSTLKFNPINDDIVYEIADQKAFGGFTRTEIFK